MFKKLSESQKAKIPEYIKKWAEISLNTDRFTQETAERICNDVRTKILNQPIAPVVVFDNPVECWIAVNFAINGFSPKELPDKVDSYFNGERPSFDIIEFLRPFFLGSFDATTFAFNDFVENEMGVSFEKYEAWKATTEIGCIFNLSNVSTHDVVIVSQKPTTYKVSENFVLHNENGPAISFAGRGFNDIYALNGVVVPDWLATTPSHKIDINKYYTVRNADVKVEFIRKVGIERFLELGELIDTYENYKDEVDKEFWIKSEYELWDMCKILPGNLEYAPYLKMLNQTTRVWHVEGVSPQCRTLGDAIKDRFGGRDLHIIDIA